MHAPPVIVLGAPGPDPSRVAAMLGAHPAALALPELRLFMADTVGELLEIFAIAESGYDEGLARAVAFTEYGRRDETAIDDARDWLARRTDWSGAALLDHLARRLAPRRMVVVDTETGWQIAAADRLAEACPDASLLQVVTHPRPYCRATAERLAGRLFVAPDYKDYAVTPPVIDPQLAWLRIQLNLERLRGLLPPAQGRALRIEDLHVEPETTLAALCDWLGWPPDAPALQAMQRPERGPFSTYGPANAPGGFDPDYLRDPGFERRLPLRETLEGLIEWRGGDRGFDAGLAAKARTLGYR